MWVGAWVGVVGSSKYLYGSVGNILAHRRAIELDTIRVDPVAGRVELEVQRALRTDRSENDRRQITKHDNETTECRVHSVHGKGHRSGGEECSGRPSVEWNVWSGRHAAPSATDGRTPVG